MLNPKIEVVRVEVEEIREKFPNLYRDLKARGVVATISLYSAKALAQAYEWQNGRISHVYGSRDLFDRFNQDRVIPINPIAERA